MTLTEIEKLNTELKAPFTDVSFKEKGHIYTIRGHEEKSIKSVSSLVKYFHEPFDSEKIAPKWSKERKLKTEDTLLAWNGEGLISTEHGTRVHVFGEDYVRWKFFERGERPIVFDKQSLGVVQFIEDLPDHLVPVAIELLMYSPFYWYTGTCDGILYNTLTGNFILYDYKTNQVIVEKCYKKPPLIHVNPSYGLVQDNLGKYSVQFGFYQILLETAGFKIGGRLLVHLREDKNKKKLYKVYKTTYPKDDLLAFLETKQYLN